MNPITRPTSVRKANPDAADGPRQSFMGAPRKLMQGVTALVIAALVNTSLAPLVHAQQAKRLQTVQAKAMTEASAPTAADRYQSALQALKNSLPVNGGASSRAASPFSGAGIDHAALLESAAQGMRASWAELDARWTRAGVPRDVLSRQADLQAEFEKKHSELGAITKLPDGPARRVALEQFFAGSAGKPTHLPINLKNMPWQVLKSTRHEPLTDAPALDAKLRAAATPAQTKRQGKAALAKAPVALLKAATAPSPADLSATLDAPQTADIKALAQSLGHNPHRIYQWVHDNIHWQPTAGSVQGAQNTLDKKAGNATDTASLLVALLRASGIAARYVYGSVEVDAAPMMNWVGGAQTVDAAQQVLGQGGIPNVALVSGGQVKAIRIEHTWVEAFIEYHPGRGAKHIAGQSTPDSWVPMDASYKQYTFKQGMDLQAAVPLNAQALIDAAQQGAQTNPAEGWVRNLNTAALQSQLSAYQNQLKTYIDSQNAGNSTVGDVLGQRTATIDPLPYLAGTLPYTVKARSQQFSEVPDGLRAKFKYNIHPDARSAAWGDNSLMSFQAPTASLAGKKLTLAWVAASPADQAAIEALIPAHLTDPSQLPRTIPASVRLKPQILVDGQVKAEGTAMSAGSEPVGVGAFTRYGSSQWDETQDQLIAGQQTALGLSIQGISQVQLNTLKARMEATKAKLEQAQAAPEAQRPAILKDITGDMLTGDLLTSTIWGYFAALQSHGVIASSQAQMFDAPALSYGLFHAQVRPNKLYGIVTTGITMQGLNMDVGHLRHMRWVKDDNPNSPINNKPELTQNGKSAAQNRWIIYNKMRGQYSSAMEHAVPEQFWVDKSSCRYQDEDGSIKNPALADCAQGISAVKAIAIAQSQGQRIYTINQSNRDTALPKLTIGGDVGAEIRSAIQAGKEVTFHESPISAHGWTGYGYIMTDADTGAGGYIIEGKGNGGWLEVAIAVALAIIGLVSIPWVVSAVAIIAVLQLAISILGAYEANCSPFHAAGVMGSLTLGIILMGMISSGVPIILGLLLLISLSAIQSAINSNFVENCIRRP